MALTRRSFVRTAGIGAAGALTAAGSARAAARTASGRRSSRRSRRVEPGLICLASNENPLGPGTAVLDAVRAAFGRRRRAARPLLGQRAAPSPTPSRRNTASRPRTSCSAAGPRRSSARRRISSRRKTSRSSARSRPTRSAPATRSMMGHPVRPSRSTPTFKIDLDGSPPRRRAPAWCSTATRTTRRRPTSARRRRATSSRASTASRRTRRSSWTRRTSTTSPIPITTRTSRSPSRTRASSSRGRSRRRTAWPGCASGYAVGHADTIKKMADWDGGVGTSSLNVLAIHAALAAIEQDDAFIATERARNKDGARLHDEVVRRSRHEADRLAGQLHVRQHRPPGEGVPRRLPRQGRARRARLPAVREDRTAGSRSGRWTRCRRRWRCSATCCEAAQRPRSSAGGLTTARPTRRTSVGPGLQPGRSFFGHDGALARAAPAPIPL